MEGSGTQIGRFPGHKRFLIYRLAAGVAGHMSASDKGTQFFFLVFIEDLPS